MTLEYRNDTLCEADIPTATYEWVRITNIGKCGALHKSYMCAWSSLRPFELLTGVNRYEY